MGNPPKRKGTAGETELLRMLQDTFPEVRRTSPGEPFDLLIPGQGLFPGLGLFQALATRPDQGEWLVTIRLSDFIELLRLCRTSDRDRDETTYGAEIEVKRHRKFAHHTIFEQKFEGSSG